MSEDDIVDFNNDELVGQIILEGITSGGQAVGEGSFMIPANAQLGFWRLIFEVDGFQMIEESDETNNISARYITVTENSGNACSSFVADGQIECTEYLPDGNFRVVSNNNNNLLETILNEDGEVVSTQDLGLAIEFTLAAENGSLIKRDHNNSIISQTNLSNDFQSFSSIEAVIEFEDGYIFAVYLPFTDPADKTLAIIKTDINTNVLETNEYLSPFGFFHNLVAVNEERFVFIYNQNTGYQGSNDATLVIMDGQLNENWTKVISSLSGSVSPAVQASFRKTICGDFFMKTSGGSGGGGGGFLFANYLSDSYHVFEGDSLRLIKSSSEGSLNTGFGGTYSIRRDISFYGPSPDGGILNASETYITANTLPWLSNYIAANDTVTFSEELNGAEVWSTIKTPYINYPFDEVVKIGNRHFVLYEEESNGGVTLTALDDCNVNDYLADFVIENMTVIEYQQVAPGASEVVLDNSEVFAGSQLGIVSHLSFLTYPYPAKAFTYKREVRISSDQQISPDDFLFSTQTYNNPGLYNYLINGLNEGDLGFTYIPEDFPPGDYYIIVKYDAYDEVDESNEDNNTLLLPITIVVPEPQGDEIDLELSLSQANSTPDQYSDYSVVATITNTGDLTATDVMVSFPKPEGVVYQGSNQFDLSQGTFSPNGSQQWSVGSLAPGATANLTVNYFLLVENAPVAYAQVVAANEQDVDSTPNNGTPPIPNEDDEASTGDASPSSFLPDLVISNVDIPSSFENGASPEVAITISNEGLGDFKDTYISVRYWVGPNQVGSYEYFTGSTLDSLTLAPGESFTFTDSKSLSYLIGPTTMDFYVDLFEYVEESNEYNNFYNGVVVEFLEETNGTGIDLELSLQSSDSSPEQWSDYSVLATITNTGDETATDVMVSFPKPEGVVYQGSNQFDLSQGTFDVFGNETWSVGSLAPGATATLTVNYFLLVENAPIAYAQVVAANEQDSDSTPNNGTPPTPNEDDEASTDDSPGMLLPDLTLSNLSIINPVLEDGETLSYEFDIENIGQGQPLGSVSIRAYFSTDMDLSNDDVLGGNVGVFFDQNTTFPRINIPGMTAIGANGSALNPGEYYLILEVDDQQAIAESNESNNFVSASFTVEQSNPPNDGVDLELQMSSSENNPAIYSNFYIDLVITNHGTETATNVVVDFEKPEGVVYVGGNEYESSGGTFSPHGNELWMIDELEPGASLQLFVYYFTLTENTITPYAQVSSLTEEDIDSSPGNGTCCIAIEDDEASLGLVSFTGNSHNAFNQASSPSRPIQLKAIIPNPTITGKIEVMIFSELEGLQTLQCINALGVLENSFAVNLLEGWNKIPVDVSKLTGGTYILNMPGQNWRQMPTRFVVVRD